MSPNRLFNLCRTSALFLSLLLLMFLPACKKGPPPPQPRTSPDPGRVAGQTYTNYFFGLKITIPRAWYVSKISRARRQAPGEEEPVEDPPHLFAAIVGNNRAPQTLLMVRQYPPEDEVPFNPLLGCVTEKVSHLPGIKDGADYLRGMKEVLATGSVPYTVSEKIDTTELGGTTFAYLFARRQQGKITVREQYYVTIRKGYALGFVISYKNAEEFEILLDALQTIRLKKDPPPDPSAPG